MIPILEISIKMVLDGRKPETPSTVAGNFLIFQHSRVWP